MRRRRNKAEPAARYAAAVTRLRRAGLRPPLTPPAKPWRAAAAVQHRIYAEADRASGARRAELLALAAELGRAKRGETDAAGATQALARAHDVLGLI